MQPHLLATRPAAASEASLFRLFAYTMLLAPHQAWADDIDFRSPLDPLLRRNDIFQPSYEPDFAAFGRSIIGRAPGEVIAPLRNNHIERMNLDFGTSACYLLEESTLFGQMSANQELRIRSDGENIGGSRPSPWERQDQSKRVYFSANTCLQPHKPGDSKAPAQLKLLVSQGEGAGCPMGTDGLGDDDWIAFEDGAAMLSVEARGDVYVSVLAPPLEEGYQDVYNFELAASVDDYFHSSDLEAESGRVTTNLLWMDSDSSAALLVTRNLTDDHNEAQEVMDRGAPYELFVENDEWPVFDGIRRSVCGMRNTALIWANKDNNGRQNELVHTTMTLRGAGSLPKQEFYFEGLNATSSYNVVLVRMADVSNNTRRDVDQVRGGGIVSAQMQFKTLTGTSCKVITDLEFCDETAYAVPGNENLNGTELAKKYDDYAKQMYSNFEKVMMQVSCEAESTAKYSLARSCDDCKTAYKRWLCTVGIPRCEDYSSDNRFALVRNVGAPFPNGTMLPDDVRLSNTQMPWNNASRNRFIDEEIAPGPYKEILPCEEICYEVVQACPAVMGFACPRPGWDAFDGSYKRRSNDPEIVSCNYPGESRTRVSAASVVTSRTLLASIATVAAMSLVAL